MKIKRKGGVSPRKTPVQARAAVTVEAIGEATIQVLLAEGIERLTTTRVAARAGVSVGTLYQYYPNKEALLFALLERHLTHVAEALEGTCRELHGRPLKGMVEAVVEAFVDAKMVRADISMALYAIAANLGGDVVSKRLSGRGRRALVAMLKTAPQARFEDPEFTVTMLFAAMAGTTRMVLEGGATPKRVRMLRVELVRMCMGYLSF